MFIQYNLDNSNSSNSKFSIIQNHFEIPTHIYVCILTLYYSKSQIIQTKLSGPLDFELSRFHCIYFFLICFIKAYVMGSHLNCIDKSMQFKWVPATYIRKYTGCNLKTTELLDCALIRVCAVIRSNTERMTKIVRLKFS